MTRDEAEMALRQAIVDHAEANGLAHDDEMLCEFVVIAHWAPVEADDSSRYTTHLSRNTLPNHVAIGLFRTGERLSMEDD